MNGQPCVNTAPLDEILARYPASGTALIQVLQDVHRAYHYLPCDVLVKVAEVLDVPLAKVFSVGTFYKAFSLVPQGRTIVRVCTGTACHIRGANRLIEEIERLLKIKSGETTEDMGFTIKTVNCVGACAMAPVVIVGEQYHGSAQPAKVAKYLAETEAGHEN
jgi:NADH:ubiquinone oxidoreductase subunit E